MNRDAKWKLAADVIIVIVTFKYHLLQLLENYNPFGKCKILENDHNRMIISRTYFKYT